MRLHNIHKLLAALMVVLSTLSACDVLDTKYYMGQPTDDVFKTPSGIRSAAVGMYDIFQHAEFLGGRMQIYVDLHGLDVNPSPFFSGISSFNVTSSDGFIQNAWTGAYRSIYECNLFLENIAKVEDNVMPSAERLSYIAEARFLRATSYFYLVNYWGQQYTPKGELGVPLVLRSFDANTSVNGTAAYPRETVCKIYDQIVSDLSYAEEKLPLSWNDTYKNHVRATSMAASAMLSRVYLYLNHYDLAANEADKVITPPANSRNIGLATDLKADCFTSNQQRTASPEIIFWIAMNATDNPGNNNAIGQHYGATKRADISVSQSLINLYEPSDKRLNLIISKDAVSYCNKYPNGAQDWAPIIRYAEVILNKAEALAKSSSVIDPTALSLINDIRKRSGASPKVVGNFSSKEDFIQFILDERRRELAFEGLSSFDLFRNKKGIPAGRGTTSTPAISFPNNLFAAPIPSVEMQRNPKLIQNEGY